MRRVISLLAFLLVLALLWRWNWQHQQSQFGELILWAAPPFAVPEEASLHKIAVERWAAATGHSIQEASSNSTKEIVFAATQLPEDRAVRQKHPLQSRLLEVGLDLPPGSEPPDVMTITVLKAWKQELGGFSSVGQRRSPEGRETLPIDPAWQKLSAWRVSWFAQQPLSYLQVEPRFPLPKGRGVSSHYQFWVRATVVYFDETQKRERKGSCEFCIFYQQTPPSLISKPTPTPIPAIHFPSKLIAKMQYDTQDGKGWRDAPQPGSSNYPLKFQKSSVIGFRVIKRYPKLPWPDTPEMLPRWNVQRRKNKEEYLGDAIYVQMEEVSKTPQQWVRVTGVAGNEISTAVQVIAPIPPPKDYLFYLRCFDGTTKSWRKIPLPGQPGYPLRVPEVEMIQIGAFMNRPPQPSSWFRDDSEKDPTFFLNFMGQQKVRIASEFYMALPKPSGSAYFIDITAKGRNTLKTRVKITPVPPLVSVTAGPWKRSPGRSDLWQRPITVTSTVEVPVALKILPPTASPADRAASWLDRSSVMSQGWHSGSNVGVATQFWRFSPQATRQLSRFRVSARVLLSVKP